MYPQGGFKRDVSFETHSMFATSTWSTKTFAIPRRSTKYASPTSPWVMMCWPTKYSCLYISCTNLTS